MILSLGISAPEITLDKEAVKNPVFRGLKQGQVVRAKVLGTPSGSTAHLLIGGQKVTAQTHISLSPGQEIALKFTREKDLATFKLIQNKNALMPAQDSGIKAGVSLARMAEGLLSFEKLGREPGMELGRVLENLALKSGERDQGVLTRLLTNSGMLMEQKMATLAISQDSMARDSGMHRLIQGDLKAALLSLVARGTDKVSGDKSPSAELARSAASALENFQTLNAQPAESQRFIIPFPVMAGDQFNFGQLFMDMGKKEAGENQDPENRIIRLAFLLNLTALGDLRADFSILKKSITGRFLLEDQSICNYMKSLMPVLKERLSGIGFHMGQVDCVVAEPSQLSPGALINAMGPQKEVRGLDLVI